MKQLLIALGALAVGLFTGIIPISIGVGSMFTSVNTVMTPLVCPGDTMVPAWEYRPPKGMPRLASGPDLATRWICVDPATHVGRIEGYRTILTVGTAYGILIAALIWWVVKGKIDFSESDPGKPGSHGKGDPKKK